MGRRYRYRKYRRYYRHRYRKRGSGLRTLRKAGRIAGKAAGGVVKGAWWVVDRAALTGIKVGFGIVRGILSLGRR